MQAKDKLQILEESCCRISDIPVAICRLSVLFSFLGSFVLICPEPHLWVWHPLLWEILDPPLVSGKRHALFNISSLTEFSKVLYLQSTCDLSHITDLVVCSENAGPTRSVWLRGCSPLANY